MKLLSQLHLTAKATERPHRGAQWRTKTGVKDSEDLQRILALPRRARPTEEEQAALAEVMTAWLRLERATPCECSKLSAEPCITQLLPIQGWYLYEAAQVGGTLGHVAVGGGKTGIDVLLAMVIPGVKRAVLLIPPDLRQQFQLDYQRWAQHFRVPNLAGSAGPFWANRPTLDVLAYSKLSHESCATWLKSHAPDLIIADEGQNLKDKASVRTGRFLRYFIESSADARFCVHSGSLTTTSLDDYAHLSALSLREHSPLPLQTSVVTSWCEALDPMIGAREACPPGALEQLCRPGEHVSSGFCRRLTESAGVITSSDASIPTQLRLITRSPGPLPPLVKQLLRTARDKRERPDGEVLVEDSEVAVVLKQIACGFYYYWAYPNGEAPELIDRWFLRRSAYFRELRDKLEHRVDHLDSPKLCWDAAARFHAGYEGPLPVWEAETWPAWNEVRLQVQPEKRTKWVDEFLVFDSVKWASQHTGVVWYLHAAFGQKVAELSGLQLFGPGKDADLGIRTHPGDSSVVASIKAHGTGKNLQQWSELLVANSPSDNGRWQQLIGRHHRHGQKAPRVDAYVYAHTTEVAKSLEDAMTKAEYVVGTIGGAQKILTAEQTAEGTVKVSVPLARSGLLMRRKPNPIP